MEHLESLIKNYQTPKSAIEFMQHNPPLFIAGTTASGKNTVINELAKTTKYRHVTSHTTRTIRENEMVGREYWFTDLDTVEQMLRDEKFIEAKIVHGDTVYGTSIDAYKSIVDEGNIPLLEIDVQGVEQLMQFLLESRPFFLIPPTFEIWMHRLRTRGVMTEDKIRNRMISAQKELEIAMSDERFRVVVNDDLNETVTEIINAINFGHSTSLRNLDKAHHLLDDVKIFLGEPVAIHENA